MHKTFGCARGGFLPKQCEITKNIASFANLFRANYPLEKPKDAIHALLEFVDSYGYERQGSARAYRIIAKRVINKIFGDNISNVTQKDAEVAWYLYKQIAEDDFGSLKLNVTHNPLNSDGGVLDRLSERSKNNIYRYVARLLQTERIEQAHSFISSIRGVGPKITSLYLRDIAYLELNSAKHYHFLLQPIDTWVNQAVEIILSHTPEKTLKNPSDKQKLIVDLCRDADCSPIDFNQGAWIAGSTIAQDYGTFKDVIEDKKKAKSVIQHRIKDGEKLTFTMKNWLEDNV